jgi:hypothetical protein
MTQNEAKNFGDIVPAFAACNAAMAHEAMPKKTTRF